MSTIEKASEKLISAIAAMSESGQSRIITAEIPINTTPSNTPAPNAKTYGPPPIALDKQKMRTTGLLLPDMGNTRLAEQYRKIKHPLLRKINSNNRDQFRNNLIMVSSSLEGEGKSYTSVNLAVSIAMELDHTALLIDIDSKKDSVSKLLGISVQPGLTDYLGSNSTNIEDIIYSTDIAKLKIIPAGKFELASAEAITSMKMKSFLTEISNRYPDRVIILDTPPLLLSAIAKALVYMAGQVVLVVEAEKTPLAIVDEAMQHIEPERFSGFILNKTNLASSTEKLYGGYE